MEEQELLEQERIRESVLPSDYVDGEKLTHTDLNLIISLLREGVNANYKDLLNIENGELEAGNATKLSGASLSRLEEEVISEDDDKIPTSAQVVRYVENAKTALNSDISANESAIVELQEKVQLIIDYLGLTYSGSTE